MHHIQTCFDKLYDCVVKELQYDYLTAKLVLLLFDLETNTNHRVVFHDVDSYLVTMTGFEGKICKNIYPELSAILLASVKIETNDKWLSQYPLNYNVCIEIMDRAIVLNAHSIQIDSDVFTEPLC